MSVVNTIQYDGIRNIFYRVFSEDSCDSDYVDRKSFVEMAMTMLEDSPELSPLLINLYDNHKTYNDFEGTNSVVVDHLTEVMTSLLEVELSFSEKELIADILMSLIRQAENDLKVSLAQRLSIMTSVPLRMLLELANDEIAVADPLLRNSTILNDIDLVSIVHSQTESHWRSIAMRSEMSYKLMDTLVDTGDVGTAIILSANEKVRLNNYALNQFTEKAKNSEMLAKPLLMRKEIPSNLAITLYDYVGAELKKYIKYNFNLSAAGVSTDVVDDIVFEIKESASAQFQPTAKMVEAAEKMYQRESLDVDMMIGSLRRGQVNNFIALFSIYCSLDVLVVQEILEQDKGQGLAVACKARGIPKPDFINMYLLTCRVRGGRIIAQNQLAKALRYYDKITEDMAIEILSTSRH